MTGRLIKNRAVSVREEADGNHLAFNAEHDIGLIMNATSYFIWNLCDGNNPLEALLAALQHSFDVDATVGSPQDLGRIVTDHLELLRRVGFLVEQE